ncbi:MAG: hypothetical protein ABL962_01190, partial [Fimbriimonadaceae bacterium]
SELKAKLASLVNRLNADPEFVNCIDLGDDSEDAEIQKLFTPERMAQIAAAEADIAAGNGLSLEQLDEELAKNKAAWQLANPR